MNIRLIQRLYSFHVLQGRARILTYGCVFVVSLFYASFSAIRLARPEGRVIYETVAIVIILMFLGPLAYVLYAPVIEPRRESRAQPRARKRTGDILIVAWTVAGIALASFVVTT